MALRLARIGGIAAVLGYLFHLSARTGLARGNEDLPGTLWAIGVLAVIFLLRALVTELTESAAHNVQKDLLWGIGIGSVVTIFLRL